MKTDKTIQVLVRLSPLQAGALDAWRRDEADLPTRPEAIRRLVESALATGNASPTTTARPGMPSTESTTVPKSKVEQIAALRKARAT